MDTTNICSRASTCPFFIVVLREREPTIIHDMRPQSEHELDRFSNPEITFLTSSKSGPGRFPYRQNEYEREEKWQLSACLARSPLQGPETKHEGQNHQRQSSTQKQLDLDPETKTATWIWCGKPCAHS
jgi:hypothetical protein